MRENRQREVRERSTRTAHAHSTRHYRTHRPQAPRSLMMSVVGIIHTVPFYLLMEARWRLLLTQLTSTSQAHGRPPEPSRPAQYTTASPFCPVHAHRAIENPPHSLNTPTCTMSLDHGGPDESHVMLTQLTRSLNVDPWLTMSHHLLSHVSTVQYDSVTSCKPYSKMPGMYTILMRVAHADIRDQTCSC